VRRIDLFETHESLERIDPADEPAVAALVG
jgi:hypothetical protein